MKKLYLIISLVLIVCNAFADDKKLTKEEEYKLCEEVLKNEKTLQPVKGDFVTKQGTVRIDDKSDTIEGYCPKYYKKFKRGLDNYVVYKNPLNEDEYLIFGVFQSTPANLAASGILNKTTCELTKISEDDGIAMDSGNEYSFSEYDDELYIIERLTTIKYKYFSDNPDKSDYYVIDYGIPRTPILYNMNKKIYTSCKPWYEK